MPASADFDPAVVISNPVLPRVCAPLVNRARVHFVKSDEIMNRNSRRAVRAPRIMSKYYHAILDLLEQPRFSAAATARSPDQDVEDCHSHPVRVHLMQKTVHIIGAGISGLSAGVRLADAGCAVRVHEAAQQVGGRCRSYFDGATDLTIDNGNHLVLSGNHSVLAYARKHRHRGWFAGAAEGRIPVYRSRRRQALEAADQRRARPVLGVRPQPPSARHLARRLLRAGAADLRQYPHTGWRRHQVRRRALQAAGAAALARSAQHRSARRIGRSCRCDHSRNAAGGWSSVPPADCA